MDRLLGWKQQVDRKPLLIKGVRQVGKTHLLKEFGKEHFDAVHYFNFEKEPALARIFEPDYVPSRILTDLSFLSKKPIKEGRDLVIFDEIQECPKALNSLKYFCEDAPNLHLCGAGSLLGIHLSSVSFPVGKVTFETLRPMSFEEFLLASGDPALEFYQNGRISETVHEHLLQLLKYYLIVGGLPEVVGVFLQNKNDLFTACRLARKKQEDLLNSYYADMAKHAGKVNAMHLDRVFRAVPMQLAKHQDGGIARFRFRGVVPGVSHYDRLVGAIDWLHNAGLVVKVHITNQGFLPFRGYSKENVFKLLLFDVGILGLMSGLPPEAILEADFGSYKGFFIENFVAQELLTSGFDDLFSWQEKNLELDFILEIAGKVLPLEVKSGKNTRASSLEKFCDKYCPIYRIIVSAKNGDKDKSSKTHSYPIYKASKIYPEELNFLQSRRD